MNYEELKYVVRYIKRVINCSECNEKFISKDVNLLGVFPKEAVFQLDCKKCKNTMIVDIGIQYEKKQNHMINKKDVENMRNFLEKFNGDFKSLFRH